MYLLPSVKRPFLVCWLVAECRFPVHKQRCVLILLGKQTCQFSLSYSCPFVCPPIRAHAHLSVYPLSRSESSQPSQDFRDRLLTVLRGLVIFFSVSKQLTEHQHHRMVVANQQSHKTKVCDKSWKENEAKFEARVEGCPGSDRLCFSYNKHPYNDKNVDICQKLLIRDVSVDEFLRRRSINLPQLCIELSLGEAWIDL